MGKKNIEPLRIEEILEEVGNFSPQILELYWKKLLQETKYEDELRDIINARLEGIYGDKHNILLLRTSYSKPDRKRVGVAAYLIAKEEMKFGNTKK